MANITINIPLDSLSAAVTGRLKQIKANLHKALFITTSMHAPMLAMTEVAQARPRQPVDRGTYRSNFRTGQPNDKTTVFYNLSPHAGVIEYGRRPGTMPPTAPIVAWLHRKGIVPKGDNKRAKSMAFAIALKMKREGWPSKPNRPMMILHKVHAKLEPIILSAVTDSVAATMAGPP